MFFIGFPNTIGDYISILSLLVAFFALLINYRNNRVNISSFKIKKDTQRSNDLDLMFIKSTQIEDAYIIHLAVFNPDSSGLIIKSLTIYKRIKRRNSLFSNNNFDWEKLKEATWWPTEEINDFEIKYVETDYKHVYVEKIKDLLVLLPGLRSREYYKFELKTSRGNHSHITTITGTQTQFSHFYRRHEN